jgi:hypothetical protein
MFEFQAVTDFLEVVGLEAWARGMVFADPAALGSLGMVALSWLAAD